MAVSVSVFLGFFVGLVVVGLASSKNFDELFQPSWAMDHFCYEGDLLKLKLDNYSGTYRFPDQRIKLFILFCNGFIGFMLFIESLFSAFDSHLLSSCACPIIMILPLLSHAQLVFFLRKTNEIVGGQFTGAGFQSKSKYMFGKVTIQIKLVEGDSAGTVTAFYVSKHQ